MGMRLVFYITLLSTLHLRNAAPAEFDQIWDNLIRFSSFAHKPPTQANFCQGPDSNPGDLQELPELWEETGASASGRQEGRKEGRGPLPLKLHLESKSSFQDGSKLSTKLVALRNKVVGAIFF